MNIISIWKWKKKMKLYNDENVYRNIYDQDGKSFLDICNC